jgi:general secretion pathway protein D
MTIVTHPVTRTRTIVPRRAVWQRLLSLAVVCFLSCPAHAQQQQQQATITPNFRDAEIGQVIDAVSTIIGKTIIPDPRVRGPVTIISSTPMTPSQFYEAFLSVLQVYGFVAVPSGDNIIKILPDANARQTPANDLPDRINAGSDELVTHIITVRNVNAAQIIPALRPMLPQYAHMVSIPGTNMLVISDRASNVNRLMRIIQRLDQASDDEIDVSRLETASASEIVRLVNTMFPAAGGQPDGGAASARVVADDRTNSVLVTGEQSQRLRLKTLITHLDTPLENGTGTEVIYIEYADAEELAGRLKEQIQGFVAAAAPGGGAAAGQSAAAAAADRSTMISFDKGTNALIVTAPPKVMRQIKSIVERLDIRRAQVQVEAIIAEVVITKASELGVNWVIDGSNSSGNTVPIGIFNNSVGGFDLGSIAAAIEDPDVLAQTGLPAGLTMGAGRFQDTGVNFAVLLRALRNDSNTNILQTPSIVTLDNEEAEIKIAQEVPFLTGQYANTGTSSSTTGIVNPFQTIQREEVGTILKITPQINKGDSVQLKIEVESSSVSQGLQGAVDLITNKRTISNSVLVEDGGIIVLGGLISDEVNEGEARVPILGSIPLLGELFKTRNGSKAKRNLMIFIRPTILRDGAQVAIETNAKYNVMRDQQLARRKGRVTLLPGERQPLLPPIEELSKYADPTAGADRLAPAGQSQPDEPGVQTTPLREGPVPTPVPEESQPPPR